MGCYVATGMDADISLLRRLSTYEDPFDGITRSIYASAHGDIDSEFKLNPIFLAYVGIMLYGIYISLRLFPGKINSINLRSVIEIIAITSILTTILKISFGLPIRGWNFVGILSLLYRLYPINRQYPDTLAPIA